MNEYECTQCGNTNAFSVLKHPTKNKHKAAVLCHSCGNIWIAEEYPESEGDTHEDSLATSKGSEW